MQLMAQITHSSFDAANGCINWQMKGAIRAHDGRFN
jgi:hypothetical protein